MKSLKKTEILSSFQVRIGEQAKFLSIAYSLSVVVVVLPLLVLSYTNPLLQAAAICLTLVPGIQLAHRVIGNRLDGRPEVLLALGSCLSIAAVALANGLLPYLNVTSLTTFMFIVSITLLLTEDEPYPQFSPIELTGIASISWVGMLMSFPVLRKILPSTDQTFMTHLDLPLHEALAVSIGRLGISDLPYLPGTPLRYHWLSHAWLNFERELNNSEPFEALTLLLPTIAIFISVVAAWALGRACSDSRLSPVLAAVAVAAAAFPLAGVDGAYTMVMAEISPTHTFAVPIALTLLVLLILMIKENSGEIRLLILLAFLCLALSVARAPFAITLCAGVGIASLGLLLKGQFTKQLLTLSAVLGTASVIGLTLFVTGGNSNNFSLGWNSRYASSVGLFPYGGFGAETLASVAAVSRLLLPIFWVVALITVSKARTSWFILWFGCGAWALAVVTVLFSDQAGLGQTTFVWSFYALLLPLGGSAVGMVLSQQRNLQSKVLLISFGIVLGFGVSFGVHQTVTMNFSGFFRWSLAMLGALVLSVVVLFGLLHKAALARKVIQLAAVITLFAGVGSGLAGSYWAAINERSSLATQEINRDALLAATWVRNNVPTDALFMTNRQCIDETPIGTDCFSPFFDVSALTGRSVVVEGLGFSNWPPSNDAKTRVRASRRLDPDSVEDLQVEWLWVDNRSFPAIHKVPTSASLEFQSGPIEVYRIN